MRSNKDIGKIVFQIFNPLSQIGIIKEIWITLTNKCPHSYWLSWEWNEIWLNSLPNDCKLYLIAGFIDEAPVIAFFAGYREIIRHKFFTVRDISLNQTLIPQIDDAIFIEYNSMLVDPDITIPLQLILDHLPIKKWDEFHIVRYAPQLNLLLDDSLSQKYNLSITKLISYYVSLEKIRSNNNDYLSLISANKRNQISRSLKEYKKMGNLQLLIADNIESALRIFDELVQLHQKSWIERGQPGVFSSEFNISYHKNLISNRFLSNEIQLIKVSAGEHTIGCLYNYIYCGSVLQIQGGFNYLPGSVYRPGFICHYFAIMHNAKIGLSYYDFLAGSADYKKSLSTSNNEMMDIHLQKKSMKFDLENILALAYHKYKKIRKLALFAKKRL